uniref:Uncharacterized protein n=1 Tax=Pseudo-nitzschia australis TaxID=44445 RepID=A0A7S4ARV4_9STRA|mmetsp:Transcript_4480/g.10237  ORF Transcript_4480/g.10237 Transcript_4480/m.10237 type:complete len:111 (+) Transcript_4480:207-539(+)
MVPYRTVCTVSCRALHCVVLRCIAWKRVFVSGKAADALGTQKLERDATRRRNRMARERLVRFGLVESCPIQRPSVGLSVDDQPLRSRLASTTSVCGAVRYRQQQLWREGE